MVPVWMHTPPTMSRRSTTAAFLPSLAVAMAAFCPPGPDPSTSTSKSRTRPVCPLVTHPDTPSAIRTSAFLQVFGPGGVHDLAEHLCQARMLDQVGVRADDALRLGAGLLDHVEVVEQG